MRIRNTIFERSKYGVVSGLGGFINLGEVNDEGSPDQNDDPGNNVFFRMENFGRILRGPVIIPAEMNYWYSESGTLLCSTEEIFSQWIFDNLQKKSGSNDNNSLLAHDINQIPENAMDVYPFQTRDFFARMTGLSDWTYYR